MALYFNRDRPIRLGLINNQQNQAVRTAKQGKTMNNKIQKKQGFTLIEVIAVLVVLGILAAVALPRYIDMADNARDRAIDGAIAELNGREALAWADQMLAQNGSPTAAQVAGQMSINLGDAETWTWNPEPDLNEATTTGRLEFQGNTPGVELTRTVGTVAQGPAVWTR